MRLVPSKVLDLTGMRDFPITIRIGALEYVLIKTPRGGLLLNKVQRDDKDSECSHLSGASVSTR